MNPTRVAQDGSEFDRRLVSAARRERPADGAEDRALAALGLTAVAAWAAIPPAAPSLVQAWKVKGVCALLAALVAGGAVAIMVTRSWPVAPPAPRSVPVVVPVAAVPPPPPSTRVIPMPPAPPASIAQAPVPSASPQMHAASHPSRSRPAPPAPSSSPAQPTALSGEVALIQRATQALTLQDPGGALSILSTYANRYPRGTLAAEAGYLRVQALLAQGDRGAAMELAGRLLATDPRGVLAPKLRAIVESEPIP